MKFTLSWLKEHLETTASVDAIVEALTRIGLEVEGVENPAEALKPFTIAHVLTAAPHPQADKLQILSVDTGAGDPVQVVCGAPNARANLKGVFGAPGTYVPGADITLKVAAIRGVESRGMMCSERELLLSDAHTGIIELPEDAPVGAAYAQWAGLDDPVFDIAITPNRQDCMGVSGIARDLAAAGLGTETGKARVAAPVPGSFANPVAIAVEDGAGCPVFASRVIRGVKNGPSPEWLQKRLRAVGLRPVSVLVDITNLFCLDQARPLHVYDVAKLSGTVRARRGAVGESFTALNGKDYAVTADDIVIADDARVLGLGGVMGGEFSGVTDATTDVLLESAWFEPALIGATGRRHGINSDARARFERGVDPATVLPAIEAAAQMIIDLCGGEASEVTVAGAVPVRGHVVTYRPALVAELGGIDVSADEQRGILNRLGFTDISEAADDAWRIAVPSWRRDVDGAADIVEEIIRIAGLDRLPSTPLPRRDGVALPTATPLQKLERKVRRATAARGLNEAVTWSFVSEADAAPFGGGAWTLENPISTDLAVMRPSLLPGLLQAARRNMDRGATSVRLFEIGRRYMADGEKLTLAFVLAGDRSPRDWRTGAAQGFDAFDAKAEALAALAAADAPADRLMALAPSDDWYHPGRAGRLCLGPKQALAAFGELHPRVLAAFDLKGSVVAGEIFLDAIPAPKATGKRARPVYAPPALQPVKRDFAFLVAADVTADALVKAVRGADKALIVDVALFDLFMGKGVPDGKKSIALTVTLQPVERSLTEADIDALSAKVVAAAAKAGATLRG